MSIEIGDIVQVNMDAAGMNLIMRGEVLHKPVATGDCWQFKDLDKGTIIATSEPITIYKRPQS